MGSATELNIQHHLNHSCYTKCVELSVAIRDMDREYYIGPRWNLSSSTLLTGHLIKILWKPPGALQWVEKITTETLSGRKDLEYITKAYFDVEKEDYSAIKIRFEFEKESSLNYGNGRWSQVETDLGKCVSSPSPEGGLLLPLPLEFDSSESSFPKYLQEAMFKQSGAPEFVAVLHLRAEFVKPHSMERVGMKFSLDICRPDLPLDKMDRYSLELYKMATPPKNAPGNSVTTPYSSTHGEKALSLLSASLPFTILFREFPNTAYSSCFYVNESKLANSGVERTFKVTATKKKSGRRKGAAVFTMDELMRLRNEGLMNTLTLNLATVDGIHWAKATASISLRQTVTFKTYDEYLRMGLRFVRIFAVDFSESNWDASFHGELLHVSSGEGEPKKTPYEDALELLPVQDAFSETDVFFYGYAYPKKPKDHTTLDLVEDSEEVEREKGHEHKEDYHCHKFQLVFDQYRDNVNLAILSKMTLGDTFSSFSVLGEDPLPYIPSPKKKSLGPFSCLPKPRLGTSAAAYKIYLSPLLKDLKALVSSNKQGPLRYFTAFLLTTGEFSDFDEVSRLIPALAELPLSIVFILIGNGDSFPLRKLIDCESYPKIRQNLGLVHFRSWTKWRSALLYYRTRTDAQTVFVKEVCTLIREQSVAWIRVKHPEL